MSDDRLQEIRERQANERVAASIYQEREDIAYLLSLLDRPVSQSAEQVAREIVEAFESVNFGGDKIFQHDDLIRRFTTALQSHAVKVSEDDEKAAWEIVQYISDAAIELAFTRHDLTTTEYEAEEHADVDEGVEAFKELVEEVKADALACLTGDEEGCLDPEDVDYDNEMQWLMRRIAADRASVRDAARLAEREHTLRELLEVVGHGDLDLVKGYIQAHLGMTKPISEVRDAIKRRREAMPDYDKKLEEWLS